MSRAEPIRGGDPRVGFLPGMRAMGDDRWKHETAVIDDERCVGRGTVVWGMAYVMSTSEIGEDCMLGQGVHVGADATIGARCSLQNGAQIFSGVDLDDDVFVGPHAVFTNVLTPRAFARAVAFKRTNVAKGVSIGANATILCGITIGAYAMIGAGSVVTKDVAPYTLVRGNPARTVSRVCRCGAKLITHYHGPPSRYPTHLGFTCSGGCPLQYRARGVGADSMKTPLEDINAP